MPDMLEFTSSKTSLKRYRGQNRILALFFVAAFLALVFGNLGIRLGQLDSFTVWLFILAALGVGFTYWIFRGMFSEQAEAAASQRVTFDAEGIVNANSSWTQIYAYEDIEKLIVRRSFNEIKGVVLQLPKKLVDLGTLERQDELYNTLVQKLPHIPVEIHSVSWRRTKSITGAALLALSILLLNDWMSALLMSGLMLYFGANVLWGRELVNGPVSPKRNAWIYFLMAAMFAVNAVTALVG